MALLSTGVAALQEAGARIRPALGRYLAADILTWAGRQADALAVLEEVLEFSRTTGARWLDAELHRKKGELLLALADADADQVEQEFRQAISIAREQSARLFELRAVTSLARLQSDRGASEVAAELLRPLLAWFVEDQKFRMCVKLAHCLLTWTSGFPDDAVRDPRVNYFIHGRCWPIGQAIAGANALRHREPSRFE